MARFILGPNKLICTLAAIIAVLVNRKNGRDIDDDTNSDDSYNDFNDVGNGDNVTVATATASMTKMTTTATASSCNADVNYNIENLSQRQRIQNQY